MTLLTEATNLKAFAREAIHGGTCMAIALLLLTLAGCRDSEYRDARQEVVDLRNRVAKLEASLLKAKSDIANISEELTAAIETRDTLDSQVGKLTQERNEALGLVKEAESAILSLTGRLKQADAGKSQTHAKVGQLEQTIQQLQETIIEQRTVIGELEVALQQQIVAANSQTEEIAEQELEAGDVEEEEPDDIVP